MATEEVRPLRGSSFDSFEDAVLQAISSASPTEGAGPREFKIVQLSVEIGGFIGRPQFVAEVTEDLDQDETEDPCRL